MLNQTPFSGVNGCFAYVTPDIETIRFVTDRMEDVGSPLSAEQMNDLHCTVMYSRVTPSGDPTVVSDKVYTAIPQHVEFWPGHDKAGYLVLKMESPELSALNKFYRGQGCVPTFDVYQCHMTLKTPIPHEEGKLVASALNALPMRWPAFKFYCPTACDLKQ